MQRPVFWILERTLFSDTSICICEPTLYQRGGYSTAFEIKEALENFISENKADFNIVSDIKISGDNLVIMVSDSATIDDFLNFRRFCFYSYKGHETTVKVDFDYFVMPAFVRRSLKQVFPDELSSVVENIMKRVALDLENTNSENSDYYWKLFSAKAQNYSSFLQQIFGL